MTTNRVRLFQLHILIAILCFICLPTANCQLLKSLELKNRPNIKQSSSPTLRKKKEIIIIPALGLSNRLKTISHALKLSECMSDNYLDQYSVSISWPVTSDLNASFNSLFNFSYIKDYNPKILTNYTVITKKSEYFTRDDIINYLNLKSSTNFKFIQNFNKIRKNLIIDEFKNYSQILIVSGWGSGFEFLRKSCFNKNIFKFYTNDIKHNLNKNIFNEINPILNYFNQLKQDKNETKIIGIHLRETDIISRHKETVSVEEVKLILNNYFTNKEVKEKIIIFLSSDDKKVYEDIIEIIEKYNIEVIHLKVKDEFNNDGYADRSSVNGMRAALSDLLLLGNCDEIYTNIIHSTFSQTAAKIANIKLNRLNELV